MLVPGPVSAAAPIDPRSARGRDAAQGAEYGQAGVECGGAGDHVQAVVSDQCKRDRIRATCALAAVAILAAVFWLIVLPRMEVPVLKADLSGPPIPYDRLANEATDPHYLSNRRRVHEDWLAAIARYPDVRDCLEPDERTAKRPDLRRFDWAGLRGRKDLDICLYRVFSSLGTRERSTIWLESQGFRTSEFAVGGGIVVNGRYSPRDDHVLLPGGTVLARWVTAHIIYGEVASVRWAEDGRLLRAGFMSNSL